MYLVCNSFICSLILSLFSISNFASILINQSISKKIKKNQFLIIRLKNDNIICIADRNWFCSKSLESFGKRIRAQRKNNLQINHIASWNELSE